jgi:hypothetical protein
MKNKDPNMIRLIHCMKRKDDVSVEDFRKFWDSPELIALMDAMLDKVFVADIKRNLTLDIEANHVLQAERQSKQPFDGIVEILWQSGADMAAIEQDSQFNELYARMEELQSKYIDFSESRRFITEYSP